MKEDFIEEENVMPPEDSAEKETDGQEATVAAEPIEETAQTEYEELEEVTEEIPEEETEEMTEEEAEEMTEEEAEEMTEEELYSLDEVPLDSDEAEQAEALAEEGSLDGYEEEVVALENEMVGKTSDEIDGEINGIEEAEEAAEESFLELNGEEVPEEVPAEENGEETAEEETCEAEDVTDETAEEETCEADEVTEDAAEETTCEAEEAIEEVIEEIAEDTACEVTDEPAGEIAEEAVAEEVPAQAAEQAEEQPAEQPVEQTEEPAEQPEGEEGEKPKKEEFRLTPPDNLEDILSRICAKRARKLIYRPNEALFELTATVIGTDKSNEEKIKIKNILDAEIKQGVKLGYLDKFDGLKSSELKEEYENDVVYEFADQEFKRTGLLLDGKKVKVYVYDWDMKACHHVGFVSDEDAEKIRPYLEDRELYSFDISGIITGGKYKKVTKDPETGKITVEKGNDGKLGLELDITVIKRKD